MRILASHVSHPRVLRRGVRVWVWAWVALFLLATLASAISRTLDHGKPLHQRGWLQVCSTVGPVWVPAGAAGDLETSPDKSLLAHLDACAYCVLATDRGVPPIDFDGWARPPWVALPCPVWAAPAARSVSAHLFLARGPPAST